MAFHGGFQLQKPCLKHTQAVTGTEKQANKCSRECRRLHVARQEVRRGCRDRRFTVVADGKQQVVVLRGSHE